jgi:UDP-N-acetylmuramate: L-alanyl-gamma-D-glutamyl-meso-diaminopimelate ligase
MELHLEEFRTMDLQHLIAQEDLIRRRHEFKRVFFYRVCGAGMGPAAVLMKQAGLHVEGADSAFYPPMSTYLESTGIPLHKLEAATPEMLRQFDLIVVGNSLSGKSEQARMLEKTGVPFTSFPAALGALVLKERQVIGVCGTHGKTTTTFFLTQMLESLGQKPGYLVGGIIDGRDPARLGEGKYFPIEGDEYDSGYFHKISKFRLYELKHMILTSLEFDHADIFSSVEKIEDEFRDVIPKLKGQIIMNLEYPSALKLWNEYLGSAPAKSWTSYGPGAPVGPHDVVTEENGSRFTLTLGDEDVDFETTAVGMHNVLNVTACLSFLHGEGFKIPDLQRAVKELGMVKRRQEVRGTYKGATVIDDFAHHPRAITVTLEAIRARFKNRRIITVFEPVSATARSSIFQAEFRDSLAGGSDEVIIAKPDLATTALGGSDLDGVKLAAEIQALHKRPAQCVSTLAPLRAAIDASVKSGDVLVILSNRTCLGLWESDFVQALK